MASSEELFCKALHWWTRSDVIPGPELKTLLAIMSYADFYTNEEARPSKMKLAGLIGRCRRQFQRHCRVLEALGLLVIDEERAGAPWLYRINTQLTEEEARANKRKLQGNQVETPAMVPTDDTNVAPDIEIVRNGASEPETCDLGVSPPATPVSHPCVEDDAPLRHRCHIRCDTGVTQPDTRPDTRPEPLHSDTLHRERARRRAPRSNASHSRLDHAEQINAEASRIPARHRSRYRADAEKFYLSMEGLPAQHRMRATQTLAHLLESETLDWRRVEGFLQAIIKAVNNRKNVMQVIKHHEPPRVNGAALLRGIDYEIPDRQRLAADILPQHRRG